MRPAKISSAAMASCGFILAAAPAAQACMNSTFTGNYATTFTGFVGSVTLNAEALLIADGAGGFTGQISYAKNGRIHHNLSITGSWSLNNNCTGSGSINNSQLGTVNFDFTLTPAGKIINGVETDTGTAVTITGSR